jgi:dCTP deaminase
MCVLTRDCLLSEIESGRLRLDPFDPDQVGPASIDLHLGTEIREPVASDDGPLEIDDHGDATPETRLVQMDPRYVLHPGRTVHGVTTERVTLPPYLCAWIEGRSRIARLGLAVHVTSGFVQPGVCNHQVLEMTNLSDRPLVLRPGIRICQIVVERTEGEAVYRGRFSTQTAP